MRSARATPGRSFAAREILCLGLKVIADQVLEDGTDPVLRGLAAMRYLAFKAIDAFTPLMEQNDQCKAGLHILRDIVGGRLDYDTPNWDAARTALSRLAEDIDDPPYLLGDTPHEAEEDAAMFVRSQCPSAWQR